MKIAFLGMGLMGAPMAINCLKAGHSVTVWNRTAEKCSAPREAGAEVAASPALAVAGAEVVLICVEDTAAVEQLLFGEAGVAAGLGKGGEGVIVVDHSTISAAGEAEFAERLKSSCGATLIDGPVTGGDIGARAGTLSIMVGGPAEAFERVRPLLEAMGRTITHIGPRVGDGQRAKMINQLVVALNLIATSEGMRLGESLGLDMTRVLAAIGGGAAGSWSLNNLGPKWLARDFAPGFRLRHLLKDIRFCDEALRESAASPAGASFPGMALALELLNRAVEAGLGDQGTQALEAPLDSRRSGGNG